MLFHRLISQFLKNHVYVSSCLVCPFCGVYLSPRENVKTERIDYHNGQDERVVKYVDSIICWGCGRPLDITKRTYHHFTGEYCCNGTKCIQLNDSNETVFSASTPINTESGWNYLIIDVINQFQCTRCMQIHQVWSYLTFKTVQHITINYGPIHD